MVDYPGERRLGLSIRSVAVESLIKPRDGPSRERGRAVLEGGGAEALLQVRGASVSGDARAERYGSRPRPLSSAEGLVALALDLHLQERDCTRENGLGSFLRE